VRDIVAFLKARYDEEERRALAMEHRTVPGEEFYSCPASRTEPLGDLEWGEAFCDCFLAKLKARALREVKAKRAILAAIVEADAASTAVDNIEISPYLARDLLGMLALPYAGHPDYDQSWEAT
jgi:hypothetical protein